ncbi:PIN/TRAM domain-containing protein [Thermicanus aegyptius]|uniref:PIN/TRAM domain-containing protein n=1 Tax=Thermicanus aegyptius TaxID=94009 RepID=UPI00049133E4|nr:PIN/TRAM domain-containing protein [Thermicanus aegyptius]
MVRRTVQLFFLILGGVLGYHLIPPLFKILNPWLNLGDLMYQEYIGAAIGALIFLAAVVWLSDSFVQAFKWVEDRIIRIHVSDLLFGTLGLILGLIIAFLLFLPLQQIPYVNTFLPVFISVLLGYLGFQVGYKKKDEILTFLSMPKGKDKGEGKERQTELKLLDTSVIIDGRIADICHTGFLEGTLVIPQFVLEELQHIADSSDVLKRNRGRRGLDILNRIQKEKNVKVIIYEQDFEEIQEVDSKLVKLAKVLSGKVLTNDFNLNKVCELQGIPVLNINDLANAVKPIVLPGEELTVQVIKDGKEHGQGVAYLDDGTMIVVEGGKDFIGEHVDVMVTSVLQTSAGRMVFAKPKLLEKAL